MAVTYQLHYYENDVFMHFSPDITDIEEVKFLINKWVSSNEVRLLINKWVSSNRTVKIYKSSIIEISIEDLK